MIEMVNDKNEHMRIWAMKLWWTKEKHPKKQAKQSWNGAASKNQPFGKIASCISHEKLIEQDRWKLAEILSGSQDLKNDPFFHSWYGMGLSNLSKQSRRSSRFGEDQQVDYINGMDSKETCRIVDLTKRLIWGILHFLVAGHKVQILSKTVAISIRSIGSS